LTSTKTNPLFGRREVAFTIDERSTPSRSAVRRELAVTLRAELDQIYVRSLETRSGTRQTVGSAHIYDDPVKALEVEPQHIIERNKVPEAASAVEPARSNVGHYFQALRGQRWKTCAEETLLQPLWQGLLHG
jgi:small subunit ribosomal protein S24e